MVFSNDDLAVIKILFEEKGWRGKRIVQEYPRKNWSRQSINRVINKLIETGSVARKPGSGRPTTATTVENAESVDQLCQSQENAPGTHQSQRKMASTLNISRRSVQRILSKKQLKAYKRMPTTRLTTDVKKKRKVRCRALYTRFSKSDIKNIVFTDEKDFTLEIPLNRQNSRVYGSSNERNSSIAPERLYHETSRFSIKINGICWSFDAR